MNIRTQVESLYALEVIGFSRPDLLTKAGEDLRAERLGILRGLLTALAVPEDDPFAGQTMAGNGPTAVDPSKRTWNQFWLLKRTGFPAYYATITPEKFAAWDPETQGKWVEKCLSGQRMGLDTPWPKVPASTTPPQGETQEQTQQTTPEEEDPFLGDVKAKEPSEEEQVKAIVDKMRGIDDKLYYRALSETVPKWESPFPLEGAQRVRDTFDRFLTERDQGTA